MLRAISYSSAITKKIGTHIAQEIARKEVLKKEPVFILLEGNLGAGKTTFTMGFLNYFGIKPSAASPTFTIMKHYRETQNANIKTQNHNLKPKNKKNLVREIYHFDAYRLKSKKDLEVIGFRAIKKQPNTVVLIEWPGNVKGTKFSDAIRIKFEYGEKENERVITIRP